VSGRSGTGDLVQKSGGDDVAASAVAARPFSLWPTGDWCGGASHGGF